MCTRRRYYKCGHPLCIATVPCGDFGWNDTLVEDCACPIQTTAAMPDPTECEVGSYTQCEATGQLFCKPTSSATGVATLCTGSIEPGSCESDSGLENNACPVTDRWAEFYVGLGTDPSLESLCDAPCNVTVGEVDCDWTRCCRWAEYGDGVHCAAPVDGSCHQADHAARLCPTSRFNKTKCDHITVPSIIGDDTCLCNTGFEFDADNSTCVVKDYGTDTLCGVNEYAAYDQVNDSYQCLVHTECSGDVVAEPTDTSDRVCAAVPTVCFGIVDGDGICVTPEPTCTSIQFVRGSLPSGDPDCVNLSPPCPSHTYEVIPPTPTSDRVCRRYTVFHTGAAVALAVAPSAMYAVLAIFVRKR